MERLTEKREGGAWPRKIWSSETIAECLDRLAACEAIQVAAMAQKFLEMENGKKG